MQSSKYTKREKNFVNLFRLSSRLVILSIFTRLSLESLYLLLFTSSTMSVTMSFSVGRKSPEPGCYWELCLSGKKAPEQSDMPHAHSKPVYPIYPGEVSQSPLDFFYFIPHYSSFSFCCSLLSLSICCCLSIYLSICCGLSAVGIYKLLLYCFVHIFAGDSEWYRRV